MKKGIITVIAIIGIFGFMGCVSYSHTQAVRNETGFTVRAVYTRDTGANDWEENVDQHWDSLKIDNETQIVLFGDSSSSETPRGMRNQDIAIVDSRGLIYIKYDVPITFTKTKITYMVMVGPSQEVLTTSDPITFTVEDRAPILFVENRTGYEINLIDPVARTIRNQANIQYQPMEINQSIDIIYQIGQTEYTEQVTMKDENITITLTKIPPFLTIVNNVGVTINTIFLRKPGNPSWVGGNIVIRNGMVYLGGAGRAQTGDISGSIVNRDNMKLWLGNIDLSGNTFDIRIDDVQGSSYVKSNVQIIEDMSLTFTQTDKR